MKLGAVWGITAIALASTAYAQAPDFESAVRPLLRAKCLVCHNDRNRSSGLSLATREGFLAGGNRGSVLKILIPAVEQTGDLKMPLGGKLTAEQTGVLRRWVDAGAPWPAAAEASASKPHGADWWAFQPVKRVDPPGGGNPIDWFIRARLDKEHLALSPEADRATLLRRVTLDLTGLLPSPAEIREFENDRRPDAYERVVDRLLASPHYGERWGRHWLDVARYADSDGYTIDSPRTMWRYRDWVIRAINQDMPFDRFVIEQVAGDLLPKATTEQLIATGFHRNTPSNQEGGIDFEQYRVEAVADRVATTGAAFLGLTLGCARCHDHKYDPISQREFYQLFAFFNNTTEIASEDERREFNRPKLAVPTPEEAARGRAFEAQRAVLGRELVQYVRELSARKAPLPDPGLEERVKNFRELNRHKPPITMALIMRELPHPRESYVHLGGEFTRHGVRVEPGVPAVLPPLPPGATSRLDLARWLVDPQNPLTPRVTVNRIWQMYFGKGIVETENDFGTQGAKPSHPELLDWLAGEFLRSHWSQKAIHRLIVTSATYRQSSAKRPDAEEVDPYNKLLARQNRLRLDAEIIRDAALSASGLLSETVGGPSVYPPIPEGALAVTQVTRAWPTNTGPDRYRRGLYTFFWRSAVYPALAVFDAPDATSSCTRRVRSNTPLQALTTLNDQAFIELAEGLGARVLKEAPKDDAARVRYAYLLAIGRPPRSAETARMLAFLNRREQEFGSHPGTMAPWTSVSRVLLNLDDFLTRE